MNSTNRTQIIRGKKTAPTMTQLDKRRIEASYKNMREFFSTKSLEEMKTISETGQFVNAVGIPKKLGNGAYKLAFEHEFLTKQLSIRDEKTAS